MLAASPAEGSEPVCDPEQPTHCALDLREGDAAPFTGQLLTPELAISLGMKAEQAEARCELKLDRERGLRSIEVSKLNQLMAIESQACDATERRLLEDLEQAGDRPLIEHPAFVATVTAVTTAVVMVGIWWVAVQTVQATAP